MSSSSVSASKHKSTSHSSRSPQHHGSDNELDGDDVAQLEAQLAELDASTAAADGTTNDALTEALRKEAEEYSHQHPNDARLAAKGHAKDVDISDLTMAIQGHELLTLARLRLMHGRRYGLVGRNGIGKSTLLRRIASKQIGGFPSHLRCYLVQQEIEGTEKTVLQTVIESDAERMKLLEQEKLLLKSKKPEDEAKLNEVYEQLAAIDADSAEARAGEALDEMGFTKEQQAQQTKQLSGGWRMRGQK